MERVSRVSWTACGRETAVSDVVKRRETLLIDQSGSATNVRTRDAEQEAHRNEARSSIARGSGRVFAGAECGGYGLRTKARRGLARLQPRQPGEHVDPRGSHCLRAAADDGGLQQPRHVQAGREA